MRKQLQKLEMLLKLERDDSNLKTDAEKKLAIIYSFIGKNSQSTDSSS